MSLSKAGHPASHPCQLVERTPSRYALCMNGQSGRVEQISVSDGGVPKLPVPRARLTANGVEGDRQQNLKAHGGPDRAVCLFSAEVVERLRAEGHPIEAGSAGENLTVSGLDWALVVPGARLRIGDTAVLEVTGYTSPCRWIAGSFADGDFTRISQDKHPGESRVYARVWVEGEVTEGDPVEVVA